MRAAERNARSRRERSMQPRTLVAVIGGGTVEPEVRQQAVEVGYELGRRGLSLVCGGLGGVMEACCEGLVRARELHLTDVLTVGILPGPLAGDANPWVDVAIPTGMGIGRNLLVVRSAAAVIVVDGASGTLSELACAWQLGRPIVALSGSGGIAESWAGRAIDRRRGDQVRAATSPEAAVELVAKMLGA